MWPNVVDMLSKVVDMWPKVVDMWSKVVDMWPEVETSGGAPLDFGRVGAPPRG